MPINKTSCKQTQDIETKIIRELEASPDKVRTFSAFEDEIIRKYYPVKGGLAVAKALGKTPSQIKYRVQSLGVKRI